MIKKLGCCDGRVRIIKNDLAFNLSFSHQVNILAWFASLLSKATQKWNVKRKIAENFITQPASKTGDSGLKLKSVHLSSHVQVHIFKQILYKTALRYAVKFYF